MTMMSFSNVKHFFEQVESLPNTILSLNVTEQGSSPPFLPDRLPTLREVAEYLEHSECHLFSTSAQLIDGNRLVLHLDGKKQEILFSAWPVKSASEIDQPQSQNFESASALADQTLGSSPGQDSVTNELQVPNTGAHQASNSNDDDQASSLHVDQTFNSNEEQASSLESDETQDSRDEQNASLLPEQRQPSTFEQIVKIYIACAEHILKPPGATCHNAVQVDSRMNGLFRCFEMLHIFNEVNERSNHLISYKSFYIPKLDELVNLQEDLFQYRQCTAKDKLFFYNYPFLMDSTAKSYVLCTELALKKQAAIEEYQKSLLEQFKEQYMDKFEAYLSAGLLTKAAIDNSIRAEFCKQAQQRVQFFLSIKSRDHVFEEAMGQIAAALMLNGQVLRRPLLVSFPLENAGGEGGVRQEFFNTLHKQVMDPSYGMFTTESDDSMNQDHLLWFRPLTNPMHFYFLGVLCGLAVYNNSYFGLPFPLAFFKKLLGKPVGFEDLKELRPTFVRSWEKTLNFGPEEVAGLCATFEYEYKCGAQTSTIPLVENGHQKSVTQENKHEYVQLCADLVLNKLVQKEFEHFSSGFKSIISQDILALFRPEELQEMMAGVEEFDWVSLRQNAWYEGMYNKNHQTIKWFWEVVIEEMDDIKKRQFMKFLTSYERCTVSAMRTLEIKIIPEDPDEDGYLGLPFSHTCAATLRLPPYDSKEVLKERLLYVINQTETFGSSSNSFYR